MQPQYRADIGFFLVHNRAEKLPGRFNIVGYPHVPVTPFGIKDWEKWDTVEQDKSAVRLDGFTSRSGKRKIEKIADPAKTIQNPEDAKRMII